MSGLCCSCKGLDESQRLTNLPLTCDAYVQVLDTGCSYLINILVPECHVLAHPLLSLAAVEEQV